MPSSGIHLSSVTYWRPAAGVEVDQHRDRVGEHGHACRPARPSAPPSRGRNAPEQAGRERQEEHDRQVDRHELARSGSRGSRPADAEQQQQRVGAQVAGLDRARERGARRGRRRWRRRRSMPCTKSRLDHARGRSAPAVATGRTKSGVVELVEVPLVDEEACAARGKRSRSRAVGAAAAHVDAVGAAPMPAMRDQRRRPRRPIHSAPSLGAVVREARVGEGRLEELLDHVVDAGDRDARRPTSASSASGAIAALHRPLALGDVVLGAGEADVGVLGLAGHRVRRLAVGQRGRRSSSTRLRHRRRRRRRGTPSGTRRRR